MLLVERNILVCQIFLYKTILINRLVWLPIYVHYCYHQKKKQIAIIKWFFGIKITTPHWPIGISPFCCKRCWKVRLSTGWRSHIGLPKLDDARDWLQPDWPADWLINRLRLNCSTRVTLGCWRGCWVIWDFFTRLQLAAFGTVTRGSRNPKMAQKYDLLDPFRWREGLDTAKNSCKNVYDPFFSCCCCCCRWVET